MHNGIADILKQHYEETGDPLFSHKGVPMMYLPCGVIRHVRINARWIRNCRDKMTDYYPVIIFEGGEPTYWNHVEFLESSNTLVSNLGERSVRMASQGAAISR